MRKRRKSKDEQTSCFVFVLAVTQRIPLAACSKATNSPSNGSEGSSGKKVTLNVALWDENVSEVMKKSIEIYKKDHPNVDVKVTYTPGRIIGAS
ncbi:hypothetical protein LJK88_23985 [Paenibacillus sp. P26]|nr:hypothetical protein LJK88_23985 [Paenibacillus sp. P26]